MKQQCNKLMIWESMPKRKVMSMIIQNHSLETLTVWSETLKQDKPEKKWKRNSKEENWESRMVIKILNKLKKISFNKFTVCKVKHLSNQWNLKSKEGKSLPHNTSLTSKLQTQKFLRSLLNHFWVKTNKISN